jgi:hypothetical protein
VGLFGVEDAVEGGKPAARNRLTLRSEATDEVDDSVLGLLRELVEDLQELRLTG